MFKLETTLFFLSLISGAPKLKTKEWLRRFLGDSRTFTWIISNAIQRRPTNSDGSDNRSSLRIQDNKMAFRASSSQDDAKRMETQRNAFISDLGDPEEFVLPPECDVLVVASGGEKFVVGVYRKAPQLPSVSKYDLRKRNNWWEVLMEYCHVLGWIFFEVSLLGCCSSSYLRRCFHRFFRVFVGTKIWHHRKFRAAKILSFNWGRVGRLVVLLLCL